MTAVVSDRCAALALTPVSRETSAQFDLLVAELDRWQRVKNLVGENTLHTVWTRHIADSLQLREHASGARHWVDLGAGAGFPGLVLAISLADQADALVHLVESNARKCAFLRHAARVTAAPVQVHEMRICARCSRRGGREHPPDRRG